jgi:CheY-like chemotaxis protein
MLSLFLGQHDCDVTLAHSLREGLQQLSRGWDVILSDIGLDDGSGLEIGRQAARLPSRPAKLIALSGFLLRIIDA